MNILDGFLVQEEIDLPTGSSYSAPQTLDELVKWEPYIRKIGAREGISFWELDDFCQQVYVEFIERDYLSIYDPTKSRWTTFFGRFVAVRAMRDRDKANRIRSKTDSREMTDEYEEVDYGCVVIPDPVDFFLVSEQKMRLQQILADLKESSRIIELVVHRFKNEDGLVRIVTIERSEYTLAVMLMMGLTQREIAKVFIRSTGTIAGMVKKLRQNPILVRATLEVNNLEMS